MLELNDLASQRETFSAIAGYAVDQMVLDPGDGSELRPDEVHFVTPNFFATLRVRPVIGAGLSAGGTADAPGSELVAVISHLLWEQLGGDSRAPVMDPIAIGLPSKRFTATRDGNCSSAGLVFRNLVVPVRLWG